MPAIIAKTECDNSDRFCHHCKIQQLNKFEFARMGLLVCTKLWYNLLASWMLEECHTPIIHDKSLLPHSDCSNVLRITKLLTKNSVLYLWLKLPVKNILPWSTAVCVCFTRVILLYFSLVKTLHWISGSHPVKWATA